MNSATVKRFTSQWRHNGHDWVSNYQPHYCLLHPLHWRHNGRDSVSNHQPQDCLLNRLFGRRSKKISKLRVTGHCAGNSAVTGEFPAQMASNAENVSFWWRHHDLTSSYQMRFITIKLRCSGFYNHLTLKGATLCSSCSGTVQRFQQKSDIRRYCIQQSNNNWIKIWTVKWNRYGTTRFHRIMSTRRGRVTSYDAIDLGVRCYSQVTWRNHAITWTSVYLFQLELN